MLEMAQRKPRITDQWRSPLLLQVIDTLRRRCSYHEISRPSPGASEIASPTWKRAGSPACSRRPSLIYPQLIAFEGVRRVFNRRKHTQPRTDASTATCGKQPPLSQRRIANKAAASPVRSYSGKAPKLSGRYLGQLTGNHPHHNGHLRGWAAIFC